MTHNGESVDMSQASGHVNSKSIGHMLSAEAAAALIGDKICDGLRMCTADSTFCRDAYFCYTKAAYREL